MYQKETDILFWWEQMESNHRCRSG